MQKENLLKEFPIKIIKINHIDFFNAFSSLRQLNDKPKVLYYRGNIDMLKSIKAVAIVGTRKCSAYGKEVAFYFAQQLSQHNLCIISGMARGIDTFAHKGCLQANGKTIAVLGTGLDEKTIYPQENLTLCKEILENDGCIISEYPPTYPGNKYTFPKRNRIISALCDAVIVVEAKLRSGALITADYARQQNKKIFAIPGSIFNQNSKGTHKLIKNKALLADNVSDILSVLNIKPNAFVPDATQHNNLNIAPKQDRISLDILRLLSNGNMHIEKIIEKLNLPANEIMASISLLEANDKIKNLGGDNYIITR